MWQGWINLVLGAWLIISSFVPLLQTPANLIIVGILAVVFGFWAYKDWRGDIAGILGLWIFLSGSRFNLVFSWNFIISGIVLSIFGFWYAVLPNHRTKPPQDWKSRSVLED
jgi:hypothetical protein